MNEYTNNFGLMSNPYLGSSQTTLGGLSGTSSTGGYAYGLPSLCLTSKKAHMQAKIGIFKVKRDEDNNIISSEFVKEFWAEKIEGVSIDLLAAKELEDNFNPKEVVVKEIYTVNLNY
jgi:hypothetical protein